MARTNRRPAPVSRDDRSAGSRARLSSAPPARSANAPPSRTHTASRGQVAGPARMALLPLLNPPFTSIAAILVMTPLLVGFGRDWLVVSCRLRIDGNHRTALDHWVGVATARFLPLLLRPLLLACGIATLVQGAASLPHPFWLWPLGLCCLLAGIGWLGRSAALLLTLLLSSSLTPYGTGLPVLVLFGIAATLMLTGTGPLSLWSPEEGILYRRNRHGSAAGNGIS